MQNRKMIYVIIIVVCAFMSIFLILLENNQSPSSTSSKKKPVEYEVTDGNTTHKGAIIGDEESRIRNYHADLLDAIADNNFSDDGSPGAFSFKTEIKRIEDEENLILFAVFTTKDNSDFFSTMKFKKKQENSVVTYSNPLFNGPTPYDFLKKTESKSNIIRRQDSRITLLNAALKQAGGVIESQPNFTWTISLFEEAKKLTLNGKKTDGVIPFKLNDHQLYFIYYDDIGEVKELQLGDEIYKPKD